MKRLGTLAVGSFALLCSLSAWAASPVFDVSGLATDDFFGYSVSTVGDLNHDGFNDLVIGAPQARENPPDQPPTIPDPKSGYFEIISGRDGDLLRKMFLGAYGNRTGWSVAGLGDTNGDQTADILVGSPAINMNTQGSAFLLMNMGGAVEVISGISPEDWFGYDVASLGDLDSDNRDDFAISAPASGASTGAIRIYSGGQVAQGNPGLLQTLTVAGSFGLGADVAGGGDVNHDGIPDLVAGSWNHHLYVFFGTAGGVNATPQDLDLGVDVAAVELVGDLDQDGFDDVVASSEVNSSIYLFRGGAVGVATTPIVLGPPTTLPIDVHYFGYSLTKAYDLDCDGPTIADHDDLFVGVPLSEGGKVHAVSFDSAASTFSLIGSATDYAGLTPEAQYGFSISAGWLGGPASSTQVVIGEPMHGSGKVSVYRVECGITATPTPTPTPSSGASGNPGAGGGSAATSAVVDTASKSAGACSAGSDHQGLDLSLLAAVALPLIYARSRKSRGAYAVTGTR